MSIYHTPYTYLIGWSNHNTYYYGVRYARDCQPSDLWESYFTSSNYVSDFRDEHGEPDIIQVRKTFNDAKSAVDFEEKVLHKIFASGYWDNWLNVNISGAIIMTDDIKSKISESHKGKKHTEETLKKMSKAKKGKKLTEDTRRKMSESTKGENNPNYGKKTSEETRRKISEALKGKNHPNYGKKTSEETRRKISEALKGKTISESA